LLMDCLPVPTSCPTPKPPSPPPTAPGKRLSPASCRPGRDPLPGRHATALIRQHAASSGAAFRRRCVRLSEDPRGPRIWGIHLDIEHTHGRRPGNPDGSAGPGARRRGPRPGTNPRTRLRPHGRWGWSRGLPCQPDGLSPGRQRLHRWRRFHSPRLTADEARRHWNVLTTLITRPAFDKKAHVIATCFRNEVMSRDGAK
jgi:hypothetical protein